MLNFGKLLFRVIFLGWNFWKSGRAAECVCFENRCWFTPTGGSNPSSSIILTQILSLQDCKLKKKLENKFKTRYKRTLGEFIKNSLYYQWAFFAGSAIVKF